MTDRRKLFILLLSIFVCASMVGTLHDSSRLSKTTSVIQADQSEVGLQIAACIEVRERTLPSSPLVKNDREEDFLGKAETALEKLTEQDPTNLNSIAKRIVVCQQMHKDIAGLVEQLKRTDQANATPLSRAVNQVYQISPTNRPDPSVVQQVEQDLSKLGQSWYKSKLSIELYRRSGDQAKLAAAQADFVDRYQKLGDRFIVFALAVATLAVGGMIVMIGWLVLTLDERRLESDDPEDTASVAEARSAVEPSIAPPAPWDLSTVATVFLLWLATQITVSYVVQGAVRGMKLLNYGVLAAALGMMVIYLISNGPGPLFIYLLALRTHGIRFLEGVKLRFRVGKRGPLRLIAAGFLTWMAAVPLVIGAFLIAINLFKSQGSSNPIIALVMEAARAANPVATIIFYFTVGVLAPFCEETLFRGFLYSYLRGRWPVFPSVLVSGVLFAGIHLDYGGFLPLCVLGMLFAVVVERTKSILPSIVAHGLWNSGTFSIVLFLLGS